MSKNAYSMLLEGWGFWLIADVLNEDHISIVACLLVFGVWEIMDVLFLFKVEIEFVIVYL